jgi:hypothetical protein
MNERCNNCGEELFAGQQFCRKCGAPTRKFASGEMPTQILPGAQTPPPQTAQQPYASTTPLGNRDTDGFYRSHVAQQYQSPAIGTQQYGSAVASAQTGQLERRRSRWRGWLVALLCALCLLVVGSIFAANFVAGIIRNRTQSIVRKTTRDIKIPPIPSVPDVPTIPSMNDANEGDLSPLDETGAQVSGDTTVVTKTFALQPGAAFSLQQIKGDVTVEGWDQDQAQVTITKRGGDAEDRAGVEIMHAATDKGLTLRTPEDMDTLSEIKYEIKLPRGLRQIEINGQDSDVSLSNLAGSVAVNTMRGDLTLSKLTGAVALHTMKGDIKVDLKGATPAQAQSFNTVKGDITLAVGGANAEVRAETVSGGVSADNGLGVSVEKQIAGSRATGTIGKGGQEIVAKTVRGDVKIKN